ncbi:hypothetical protein [Magnetospirillum sp. UT-4]|uniref:hypothetical protein n=1 Tax=Magnetospirillum sp. UT-4 TaxID=2681467 RepID=UPI001385F766|nr:hypothetical protein [Magnetospirillum sp. UT-4]CAA7611300.1 hypothetical protein MTBUT4_10006 [Magnetospirillum sp. UT-4]
MNVQWTRHDRRLDVDLAVALQACGQALIRATSAGQLDEAVVLNLRLWRSIRALAGRCASLGDRDVLVDTADHVAGLLAVEALPCPDPRDVAFVAGRNLSLAGDLAGPIALQSGRDRLLAEWAADGAAKRRFEPWVIERLACAACP